MPVLASKHLRLQAVKEVLAASFSVRPEVRKPKKTPIKLGMAIENLGLSGGCAGFNLQLSDSSGANRVTSPGKTGSNHLLPSHCETIHLSVAKPDGMGLMLAINPGQSNCPGFFLFQMTRCAKKALIFGGQA